MQARGRAASLKLFSHDHKLLRARYLKNKLLFYQNSLPATLVFLVFIYTA